MSRTVAVTGATGYIGGRLVPRLLDAGHRVRVLTRDASKLRDVPWGHDVEVVTGSLDDARAAAELCEGADVVYYLVHSMGAHAGEDFPARERACARTLSAAALAAGVSRIVYLSGLNPGTRLSRHLASRTEVGRILKQSGVPTAVLQAGLVIGSGSASFEMVRHLTDVLPVMPAPRWVLNRVQPIAVRDALHYLEAAADLPGHVNQDFDIGGPDVLTYADMMRGYARAAGLREPLILALPVLTPWLAAQWVNLVTPIPRMLAIPLVESLQNDCVVREHSIDAYIPRPAGGLTGYQRAVELALGKIAQGEVETTWAGSSALDAPSDPLPSDPDWSGGTVYTDLRTETSSAPAERLWDVVEGIGGENGWYSFPLAWAVRGWIDKLVGGVGLRRGRRNPHRLQLGEALDWWRVEALEPGRLLRLRAEMRVPGRAWLEMTVEPRGEGSSYSQRAVFVPHGLAGRLYWLAVLPFHGVIFRGMASRIAAAAEASSAARPADRTPLKETNS
ncbi:SDR family oxidoreductase [Sinomonas sp. R1AF57]|uniref:SDR family oxidoreductase n=1 Tax=Sinomonas sp. R1AF57 TaxID=2020377 RepID=UPI000B5E9DD0|nr:SDR family oxidoreductase [Sinomonas sp. R1AF57]ASN53623.1 NAD(P)-dependent oxidoreductase [Sinomonas sp. R1AF57]